MPPTPEIPEVRLLLRRFALHRDHWIDTLCRHVGVSRSDYDALEALDEHGSLTPGELGVLLSLTSGSVTALLDRLEKLGWANRTRHPNDRRKVIVTLTQKPWQIGQDELKPYLEAVDATARQLSTDERAAVVGFLKTLIDKIAHAPLPQNGGDAPSHVVDGVTHTLTQRSPTTEHTVVASDIIGPGRQRRDDS